MTDTENDMTSFDFLAYGDGRLSACPARRKAVEAKLRDRPHTADALERDRALTGALRASLQGVAEEPVPPRLMAALDAPPARPKLAWPAAAVLSIAAAFGFGWTLSSGADRPGVPPDYVALDAAGEEVATLTPAAASAVAAPDISRFGLTAVAADEIALADRHLRRIVYLGPGGASLELLASPLTQEPMEPVRMAKTAAGSAAYWTADGVAYRAAADLPEDKLREIAEGLRSTIAEQPPEVLVDMAAARANSGPVVAGAEMEPQREN